MLVLLLLVGHLLRLDQDAATHQEKDFVGLATRFKQHGAGLHLKWVKHLDVIRVKPLLLVLQYFYDFYSVLVDVKHGLGPQLDGQDFEQLVNAEVLEV